jgi:hypothetical protein
VHGRRDEGIANAEVGDGSGGIFHFEQPNLIATGIAKDLKQYPLSQLQGRVQCLDGVAGFYSALY